MKFQASVPRKNRIDVTYLLDERSRKNPKKKPNWIRMGYPCWMLWIYSSRVWKVDWLAGSGLV